MTALFVLMLVVAGPVQYEPANPTVGDLITITYEDVGAGKLSVLPSDEYELVESSGNTAVVRSFRPGTFDVVAEVLTPGEQTQRRSVELTIGTVLAEGDDLEPAPLVAPKTLPPNTKARWVLASAAVVAFAAWLALFIVARRYGVGDSESAAPPVGVTDRFLSEIDRISGLSDEDEQWQQLADATRAFLFGSDRVLRRELTSRETIEEMAARRHSAQEISRVELLLRGGDRAKFSPFGSPGGMRNACDQARALATEHDQEVAA